jgi:hypothetical protein
VSLSMDRTYALLAKSYLIRFRQVRPNLFLFACPICGDNTKKRAGAGNLFRHEGRNGLMFHCYRCEVSLSMRDFLERVNSELAQEYRKESRAEWFDTRPQSHSAEEPKAPPTFKALDRDFLRNYPTIQSLPDKR